MATEEQDKVVTLGDMKGVVEIPVAEGGSFYSDKKVTLFDDESRFLKDPTKVPAYYIKDSIATGWSGREFHSSKTAAEIKNMWWEAYSAETEDEIRGAVGRFWRKGWSGAPWKTSTGLYYHIQKSSPAAPPFADHDPATYVSEPTDWVQFSSPGESGKEWKIPRRGETITFKDCEGCTPATTAVSFESSTPTPELVKLAANIAYGEHYQGEKLPLADGSKRHSDYTTTYFQAISYKEIEGKGVMNKPLYYKAESDYNFYIKSYENHTSAGFPSKNIVLLPNINVMLLEEMTRDDDEKTNFHDFVTLGGNIKDAFVDVLNQKGEKIKDVSKGQYFEKWTKASIAMDVGGSAAKQALINQYKDILMPYELNKKVVEYQDKRFLFPMFFDLEFATDTNCRFADLLDEFGLDGPLLKTIVEGSRNEFKDLHTEGAPPSDIKTQIRFKPGNDTLWTHNAQTNTQETISNRNSFIFFDEGGFNWFNQYELRGTGLFWKSTTDSFALLAPQDSDYYKMLHTGINNEGQIIKKLLMTIFRARFYKLLKEKTRSFKEILNGKKAYSEVVAYKIEKWSTKGSSWGGQEGEPRELLQNYYYTNTSKLDILKHIDTQMKYNETYHYKVYSWLVIFGTQYEYQIHDKYLPQNYGGSAPVDGKHEDWVAFYRQKMGQYGHIDVDIITQPIVKLVEVPYFSVTTKVADTPPMAPNVNLIPYKNNRNKFLINLSSQTGEAFEVPVMIEEEDFLNFFDVYQAQEIIFWGAAGKEGYQPLFFQSDDPTQIFQIFKLDRAPASYADFKGNMTEYDTATIPKYIAASSFSFVDTITPNTKYYYTFRTIDIHGHLSNPSPVYKVEIVDDGGAVYFLVELFNFEDAAAKPVTRKNMKRFISLIPAVEQRILNAEATNLTFDDLGAGEGTVIGKEPVLGTAEESIYNADNPRQFFKVRLISKLTGRKIDFNLAFEYDHKNPNVKQASDIMDSDSATTPN